MSKVAFSHGIAQTISPRLRLKIPAATDQTSPIIRTSVSRFDSIDER
jgi:hypothetical protein